MSVTLAERVATVEADVETIKSQVKTVAEKLDNLHMLLLGTLLSSVGALALMVFQLLAK